MSDLVAEAVADYAAVVPEFFFPYRPNPRQFLSLYV